MTAALVSPFAANYRLIRCRCPARIVQSQGRSTRNQPTMQVLLAGIVHETNTFAEKRTDVDEFEANGLMYGANLLNLAGTNTVIGGAVEAAAELGIALIPVVATSAIPGGLVTDRAFELVVGAIEAALAKETP